MSDKFKLIKGSVTFLDILGWKGIWQRDPKAINKISDLVTLANSHLEQIRGQNHLPAFQKDKIVITSISDTIIILMEGHPKDTIEIHGEISSYLIAQGLKLNLAIRGATSYGEYTYDGKTAILGPAVDEAASWHELTNWIGVIQSPSSFFHFLKPSVNWLKYSSTPFKSGDFKMKESLVVNWTRKYLGLNLEFSDFMTFVQSQSPLLPEISKYYANTYEFYRTQLHPNYIKLEGCETYSISLNPVPLKKETLDNSDDSPTENNVWWITEITEKEGVKLKNVSTDLLASIPLEKIEDFKKHEIFLNSVAHVYPRKLQV
jgi:hypothetical protein